MRTIQHKENIQPLAKNLVSQSAVHPIPCPLIAINRRCASSHFVITQSQDVITRNRLSSLVTTCHHICPLKNFPYICPAVTETIITEPITTAVSLEIDHHIDTLSNPPGLPTAELPKTSRPQRRHRFFTVAGERSSVFKSHFNQPNIHLVFDCWQQPLNF